MSLVLVTREDLENRSLAHYRTPGSKNGIRRWQNEDGSLTPEGRIHYGVGEARKKGEGSEPKETKEKSSKSEETQKSKNSKIQNLKEHVKKNAILQETVDHLKIKYGSKDSLAKIKNKAELQQHRLERQQSKIEKHADKAEEINKKYDKLVEKQTKKENNIVKRERSNAEIKKDVEDKIKAINAKGKEINKELNQKLIHIRELTDNELNERINRLQKEKQYAELLRDQADRERGLIRAKARKILSNSIEQFAQKTLNRLGDEMINKM